MDLGSGNLALVLVLLLARVPFGGSWQVTLLLYACFLICKTGEIMPSWQLLSVINELRGAETSHSVLVTVFYLNSVDSSNAGRCITGQKADTVPQAWQVCSYL